MSGLAARLLPTDPASRAAMLSVYLSALLMVLKIGAGLITGSVAVLSDGFDSGQDVLAAAIALISVRIGARPADHGHPYGHGRAETVAATLQALLIGAGGVFIVARAFTRLVDPPAEVGYDIGLGVMGIAAAANVALVQYTGRVARQTGSPAIASEARHLWTNVVQAGAVILGLVLVAVTGEVAFDAIVALALGAFLVSTAVRILWSALQDVLDASLSREEVALIEDAIRGQGGYGFHGLRTRRSGQSRHVDFHLTLPAHMTVEESHAIASEVEERVGALWPHTVVTVHVEPPVHVGHADAGL